MSNFLPISTISEGGFFSHPTYSLGFYMFFPFLLYPTGMVGERRSMRAVLDDLRSWDFIISPHLLYKSSLQLIRTQYHSLLRFELFSVSPVPPFLLFLSQKGGEELDNKTNSVSFLPYLEVFVGILRFLWTYHHGFWKAEGWILSQAMSFIIASFQNQLFLIAIGYASSLIWWFDEFFFLLTFYICVKLQRQIEQNG